MRTNVDGLVELDSGWVCSVSAIAPHRIRVILQYDPEHQMSTHGVKMLTLSVQEAVELADALTMAAFKAGGAKS